ncbi:hypothetical protein MPL3356_250050 [Mesorhizobium plurifarium]|uniref:Uncharacterized protein n=1 Tax=Mesorhizobium plurifarium TaxID=69974 RepID=A0A090DUE1_MESPL|nr:hypothetical protein MPL3356_250050 [Mesorhizobium plurifarium]
MRWRREEDHRVSAGAPQNLLRQAETLWNNSGRVSKQPRLFEIFLNSPVAERLLWYVGAGKVKLLAPNKTLAGADTSGARFDGSSRGGGRLMIGQFGGQSLLAPRPERPRAAYLLFLSMRDQQLRRTGNEHAP